MYPNPAGGANISGFERDWEYENQRGMVYTTSLVGVTMEPT